MTEPDSFHIELDSAADETVTVRLAGELDMADAAWVEATLAVAAEHHRFMEVDLSDIEFIDSTGIRSLIALKQQASILDIDARFTNPSPAVRRALNAADIGASLD